MIKKSLLLLSLFCSQASAGGADAKVKVTKPDNSKQCEANSGISLEEMAKELKGIKIYAKSKISDGNMYAAVCGGKTGLLNAYEISQTDLDKAIKFGFTEKK